MVVVWRCFEAELDLMDTSKLAEADLNAIIKKIAKDLRDKSAIESSETVKKLKLENQKLKNELNNQGAMNHQGLDSDNDLLNDE